MKMILLFFIVYNLFIVEVKSQIDTIQIEESVYQQATLMNEYYLSGNYDLYLNFIHPKIIKNIGGRAKMIDMFKRGIHTDFKLLSNSLQIPNHLIFTNSTIQCSIQQRQEFLMNKEKFYTLSYLIGISYDSGETWKFIGVANMSFDFIKSHFPELSNDLYVERQTKPIAIK